MVQVKILTNSEINDALLTIGIPFGKGQLQKGGGLKLTLQGKDLPLWWEERAYWPDGSVKWIFLHTRVPAGDNGLVLSTTDVKADSRTSNKVELANGKLQVEGVALEISEEGWFFRTPGGSWKLLKDGVVSEPKLELRSAPWEIELVEASPIAPLIRLKPKQVDSGILIDQFLRLDLAGERLIWQRRMTWHKPGKYYLLGAKATLLPGCVSEGEGSLFIIEPGKVSIDGAAAVKGYPQGRWDGQNHSLWVEKAWQRSPLEIGWNKKGVELCFYPDKVEPLPVLGGTSFRHTVHLSCGQMAKDVAGHQVRFSLDCEHVCKSEAMGLLTAFPKDTEGDPDFPGFERALKAAYESGRLSRMSSEGTEAGPPVPLEEESKQDIDYFGLQHYGDWPMGWGAYGGKRRMYASNEYDVAYSYFQGYARYGDWRFLEVAKHSAIHMTDVDWISLTGDMRFHGYSETAEDHGHARSATGELGHYWSDGYWMLYFLFGDVWAKESAIGVTKYLMSYFANCDENTLRKIWGQHSERNLGWPLVTLMGTYEATGDEQVLKCAKRITAYIARFTSNPDREFEQETGTPEQPIVWWRTAMQDGCKPFMLGIVMEGLERYHRATGDKEAACSIVNLARFLIENLWLPHRATFIYEWNAYNRKHRFQKPHHLTPLFVRGLGYAYELTGEEVFREVSEKAFHGCLWTLYDSKSGKSIGQMGRSMGAYVAMLTSWLQRDQERIRRSILASTGEDFEWDSGIKALVESDRVQVVQGEPEYEGDALISEGKSFVAARFTRPVATDKGEIELTVVLKPGSTTWLNQRCYLHLCDQLHNKSCVSLISFYRGIHLRIYDSHRKLIEVPEGSIDDWKEGEPHRIKATWEAPGEAVLFLDGKEVDRRPLDRPIGGEFTRLHVGHKPGNWRALGKVTIHSLNFRRVIAATKN